MGIFMEQLSKLEKEGLTQATRNILTYKLMQAKGYELLATKAADDRTVQLLKELHQQEKKDAEYWSQQLQTLGDNKQAYLSPAFEFRVRLMMGILGARRFFEWAMIAEDESVGELLILAGNLQGDSISETWVRAASDERLHLSRMKQDVLGMEAWEMGSGGGVRDVVFGANDGLVSILALVAGVFSATTESQAVLIAGIAGAIAGTVSMGAGAYVSSKSEQEVTQKEQERKGIQKKQSPEEEKEELIRFYQGKGFERKRAEAIATRVSDRVETMQEFTIGEETGLTSEEDWPPTKAGFLTGLSFLVASIIPILPFALLDVEPAAITALIASVVFLFAIGASKAIFTRQSWVQSGLEVMVIGILAAAATFVIGLLIPSEFG
jgi:VIT1/CCC1 family predicted Fe2+/Mn2+ transporter/rubrerythrin